jgi:8-oxo-dGTP diphosphatase
MKKEIRPAVAAVIFNDRHEVLLQQRSDSSKWCIISGHVEFGESVEEAILREILEETSSAAQIIRFIGLYSTPAYLTYRKGETETQYVTAYFEAVLKGDLPREYCHQETLKLCYFPIDQLPPNMDMIHPHWLSDALDKKRSVFVR